MKKRIAVLPFQKMHGRARGTIGSSIIRGEWLTNHWPEAEQTDLAFP